jgi:multiple sugar transport system ATP-binding protein
VEVLQRLDLAIADGEFLVLVGPSGCGKSTLLRLLAELESPSGGEIYVGDRPVSRLRPSERDVAMVFQSYALYPHLSVADNISFGLRRSRPRTAAEQLLDGLHRATRPWPAPLRIRSDREEAIERRVAEVATTLELEGLLERRPKELSGGQKQRVALGRAIARKPAVFLMDEPLSNLDAKLRTGTRAQIVELQRRLGTTTLYVTHDQVEAMTMGHRIAVLNGGRLQQLGTPLELYQWPANLFVAQFIGSPPMNLLPVTVAAQGQLMLEGRRLLVEGTMAEALGGRQETLFGLAGLGDLLATATRALSRNYRFGHALAEGLSTAEALQRIGATVEGVPTCAGLCRLADEHGWSLPIARQVQALVEGRIEPSRALQELMERRLRSE